MATNLVRSYTLTAGKNIHGMGQAVVKFFRSYDGTKVTLDHESSDKCEISCVTESVFSAPGFDKKFMGAVRKFSGNDVKITVSIVKKGNQVEVHYQQNISEALRAVKSIFLSFALIGVSQLYGISERHKIPIKLNDAIEAYLRK